MDVIVNPINYRTLLRDFFLLLNYCISGVSYLDSGTQLRVLRLDLMLIFFTATKLRASMLSHEPFPAQPLAR